jgi:hypothetical protein
MPTTPDDIANATDLTAQGRRNELRTYWRQEARRDPPACDLNFFPALT